MPAIRERKSNPLISPTVDQAVATNANTVSFLSDEASRDAWQIIIDQRLARWLNDPSLIADEGIETPSGTTIRLAIDFAESFRDAGYAPADSVVPDANGGIIFRRREGDLSEVLHVWDDGTVEYQQFTGARLVIRRQY